ncbi:class F sortase [Streptomyces libani]|uniref:Class F sortase n=2 Tax=Streptomyces nigrescens TaxID=1920 RepID=A0A640TYJ5_STRNI|nr:MULTISPECIES: class F sortase [Streptomyces]MCW7987019.1 peptidase C60 [Streptomyces platensis subsp. clarensis]AWN25266.1 class F sortase [Streptomyces sp. NEAU-S7GS2]MCX5444165.1 class F sortase [Streptomyces libani]MYT11397.1 class F sortase [Streptomyces sp. SID4951]WAU01228.1 class F sortase [Streptomyces libani subsp. libani]
MTAPQSPQPNSNPSRTAPASRPVGRGLLWSAGAFLLGSLLVYNSVDTSADPKPLAHPAVAQSATPRGSAATAVPDLALPRSAPKRVSIPAIAVDAPFTPLTIGPTGALNAPPAGDKNLVGWYKDGAAPGERGSAIIAGHVDTKTGPAVFLQLESLKTGATINITREDGIIATFKVDSVETFNKARFPNDRVYADAPTAQLRVITCGGAYDRKVKDYVDNVVVFAHLASFRQT